MVIYIVKIKNKNYIYLHTPLNIYCPKVCLDKNIALAYYRAIDLEVSYYSLFISVYVPVFKINANSACVSLYTVYNMYEYD